MTEIEIMKALECCCDRNITRCIKECPLRDFNGNCLCAIKIDVLDLLNRKNAEIERLKSMNQAKLDMIHDLREELETADEAKANVLELRKAINTARTEAIKEVAERVKDNLEDGWLFGKDAVCRRLDQIAKEMGVEL